MPCVLPRLLLRPDAFHKDVEHIEEVIQMERVFRCGLATSYALVLISSQAGNIQASRQVVNLLLAVAFLGSRCIASQLFFGAACQAWEGRRRFDTRGIL
jgi:hypothetical protein